MGRNSLCVLTNSNKQQVIHHYEMLSRPQDGDSSKQENPVVDLVLYQNFTHLSAIANIYLSDDLMILSFREGNGLAVNLFASHSISNPVLSRAESAETLYPKEGWYSLFQSHKTAGERQARYLDIAIDAQQLMTLTERSYVPLGVYCTGSYPQRRRYVLSVQHLSRGDSAKEAESQLLATTKYLVQFAISGNSTCQRLAYRNETTIVDSINNPQFYKSASEFLMIIFLLLFLALAVQLGIIFCRRKLRNPFSQLHNEMEISTHNNGHPMQNTILTEKKEEP